MFNAKFVHWLHQGSRGVPRLANVLAHKALLAAYGAGRHHLLVKDIKAAVHDTEDASPLGAAPWVWTLLGAVLGIVVVLVAAWGMGWIAL